MYPQFALMKCHVVPQFRLETFGMAHIEYARVGFVISHADIKGLHAKQNSSSQIKMRIREERSSWLVISRSW